MCLTLDALKELASQLFGPVPLIFETLPDRTKSAIRGKEYWYLLPSHFAIKWIFHCLELVLGSMLADADVVSEQMDLSN